MSNPLLSKVKLPGRVFSLPSLGVFYEPGVLAPHVKNGEITVSPMSALAEMKLRSADMLYSGKVVRDICAECAPEILDSGKLISKDVDALFTFLRIATYGPDMKLSSIHTCKNAKQHSYQVMIETILAKPNNAMLKHSDMLYKVALSNEQVVNLKPNTYDDSLHIMHMRLELDRGEQQGRKPSDDQVEELALNDIINVIKSVQNSESESPIFDRDQIKQWLRTISKKLFDELLAGIAASDKWGFDYELELTCKDCGKVYKHQLDLNPINFFFG